MFCDYTYEELCSMLDSDDPPPAPLTRRQVREAIQRADRATADAQLHVMRQREQQLDKAIEEMTRAMSCVDMKVRIRSSCRAHLLHHTVNRTIL